MADLGNDQLQSQLQPRQPTESGSEFGDESVGQSDTSQPLNPYHIRHNSATPRAHPRSLSPNNIHNIRAPSMNSPSHQRAASASNSPAPDTPSKLQLSRPRVERSTPTKARSSRHHPYSRPRHHRSRTDRSVKAPTPSDDASSGADLSATESYSNPVHGASRYPTDSGPAPEVEYMDISAEVEARLLAKRRARAAAKEPTVGKRKRDVSEVYIEEPRKRSKEGSPEASIGGDDATSKKPETSAGKRIARAADSTDEGESDDGNAKRRRH
jgi:hypothetical protein